MGSIRNQVSSVPILAVTATATQHVREDIVSSLRLKNPQIVSMGFDRPNIHFSFRARAKKEWDDLKPFVTNVRGSVIIYVLTKSKSEDVARFLRENGVKCEIYHAGLSMTKRRNVLDDFIKDRLKIIVATVSILSITINSCTKFCFNFFFFVLMAIRWRLVWASTNQMCVVLSTTELQKILNHITRKSVALVRTSSIIFICLSITNT